MSFDWDDAAIPRIVQAMARQNIDNAWHLAGEASQQAPVEAGDLRGSLMPDGTESRFGIEAGGMVVTVGSDLPYAAKQHEDLSLRHSGPEHGKVDGGKAKYLEDPLNANKSDYLRRLAEAGKEAMR